MSGAEVIDIVSTPLLAPWCQMVGCCCSFESAQVAAITECLQRESCPSRSRVRLLPTLVAGRRRSWLCRPCLCWGSSGLSRGEPVAGGGVRVEGVGVCPSRGVGVLCYIGGCLVPR